MEPSTSRAHQVCFNSISSVNGSFLLLHCHWSRRTKVTTATCSRKKTLFSTQRALLSFTLLRPAKEQYSLNIVHETQEGSGQDTLSPTPQLSVGCSTPYQPILLDKLSKSSTFGAVNSGANNPDLGRPSYCPTFRSVTAVVDYHTHHIPHSKR